VIIGVAGYRLTGTLPIERGDAADNIRRIAAGMNDGTAR